jgi:hypothetical protein
VHLHGQRHRGIVYPPSRARGLLRRLAVGAIALSFALAMAVAALADGPADIQSAGPLTQIIITPDLNCQVAHQADEQFEFYEPDSTVGSCGTFVAVGGQVYGPSMITPLTPTTVAWVPASQTPITGDGSGGNPYQIVTVVTGGTDLRVEEADSYVVGQQWYRTDVTVANVGQATLSGVLYRAGDCYLQGNDEGFGRVNGAAPACVVSQASDSRIEQWLPRTPGSQYSEGLFGDVWQQVASGEPFSNTCLCDETEPYDNGAGISWSFTIDPGGSAVFSHDTYFSPTGGSPVATQSYVSSVPDPTQITLDPVVVAQSAVVAAGVMLLVPFPSSLFNATLEDN